MGIELPRLDDIGYKTLRSAAQARLPASAPEWNEHNLSDPGITFLELFSWLSDVELYRLNRVTAEHDKKFLALLGDRYPTARAAHGIIVCPEAVDAGVRINAGYRCTINAAGKTLAFQSRRTFYGNPAVINSVTVLGSSNEYTTRSFNEKKIEPFYAFGGTPRAGNLFRLHLSTMPSKRLKLHIVLKESDLPPYAEGWEADYAWLTAHDSIRLSWRLIVGPNTYAMTPRRDCTLNLRYSGMVEFVLNEPILPHDETENVSVECRLADGSYMIAPFIEGIHLNVMEIEQAEPVTLTLPGSGESLQRLAIDRMQLLDPDGKGLAIESGGEERLNWERVDTLHDSRGDARHFVYDNVTQQIAFGDGRHGAVPPHGTPMHCRFRLTEGTKGNLPLRYDWEVDGLAFHNPYPIGGGSDLPDFDARFDAVDAQWRRPSRGVTLDDYEALAKATPGLRVARAKASADPVENRISVTVVPYSRNSYAMPDDFFCARVCRHLDTKRLITTRIRVTRPRYSRVALDVRIKAHPRHEEATLRKRVTDTIDHYLHPLHGGDDRKGWPFGRPVYLSDIYALLETVEGVDCIMSVTFSGEGHYDGIQKAFRVAPESLIRTTTHRVTFVRTATACGGEA